MMRGPSPFSTWTTMLCNDAHRLMDGMDTRLVNKFCQFYPAYVQIHSLKGHLQCQCKTFPKILKAMTDMESDVQSMQAIACGAIDQSFHIGNVRAYLHTLSQYQPSGQGCDFLNSYASSKIGGRIQS